jgi:hypothetical protein
MPVILALRQKQEDAKFKASLGYIDLVLKTKQKKPKKPSWFCHFLTMCPWIGLFLFPSPTYQTRES